jgi:hypothetical protein
MNEITHDQLVEKFPQVFRKIKHVECDSGWYPLLFDLFNLIEGYFIWGQLSTDTIEEIYAVQVKEKFGLLRVYLNETTPFIDGAIHLAEYMSGRICEECGMPGQLRGGNWIQTLCDEHHQAREKAKQNKGK